MAKKTAKDEAPNPASVTNRDVIQRLNFLYQASAYLHDLPGAMYTETRPSNKNKRKRSVRVVNAEDLARNAVKSMKVVGQKTVVKMDPAIKRTLCKSCNTLLVPGTTASVRVKASTSHEHAITYSCMTCTTSRRIPAPPIRELEAPESDVEGAAERKKRKKRTAKVPLFARPGIHVVYRGSEKLEEEPAVP